MPHFIDFKRRFIEGVSEELKVVLREHLEWNRSNGCLDWSDVKDISALPSTLLDEYFQVYDMVLEADNQGFDEIWVEDREEHNHDDDC